jgi:Na+-translocating ferredoxin:NAD+ oxidoreductase RnfG subunit
MRIVLAAFIALAGAAFLLRAHEDGFPQATLKKVFPEATGFTPRKKTLTAQQVQRIEQASGSKLQKNDNPLSFYVALGKSPDGSGVLGTVVMVDAVGPKGAMDLAVGARRDGAIHRVVVLASKDDPGLASAAFLDQFKGKTSQSPLAVGKDLRYSGDAKAAAVLAGAVRRGLLLLAAAEGK